MKNHLKTTIVLQRILNGHSFLNRSLFLRQNLIYLKNRAPFKHKKNRLIINFVHKVLNELSLLVKCNVQHSLDFSLQLETLKFKSFELSKLLNNFFRNVKLCYQKYCDDDVRGLFFFAKISLDSKLI